MNNIIPKERLARIIGGLLVMSLAFWGPESSWFLLGGIFVITGIVGWCPAYTALGIKPKQSSSLK